MFKIKRDINQQDFKIVTLYFVKSEQSSCCGSWQRNTTSSGKKVKLNNLTVERLWPASGSFRKTMQISYSRKMK